MLAVVGLAVYEAGYQSAVALLQCSSRAGESALPGLGLRVVAFGAEEIIGVIYGCVPGETTVAAGNGLPAWRLLAGAGKESMAVGAGAGHDAHNLAVVAVGHDGRVAVSVVAAGLICASHSLRVAPGLTVVFRVLSHEVAV